MRRIVSVLVLSIGLASSPSLADPGVTVRYLDGFLRVTLNGTYGGSYYQVWRSGELLGRYDALDASLTLCTGDCFLTDREAVPGQTYYYRFDLQVPEVGLVTYGPYAVTVPDTPLGARMWPNPSRGPARLELSVPGSSRREPAVPAKATLVDLNGRTVKTLYSGALTRGLTAVTWDGTNDEGRRLGAGVYFLRLSTPLGSSTTRIVRFQ